MTRYADVVVNRHHQRVDHIYTYRVPEHLSETIQPGWIAEVPFGGGNQLLKGYVIAVADETTLSESRMKPIRRLIGNGPVFSSEDLSLATFIKEQWGATLSSCLSLFVPRDPETALRKRQRVRLQQVGEGRVGTKQQALLAYLRARSDGSALWEDISEETGVSRESLRSLEKKGWISITNEPEGIPPAAFISKEKTVPLTLNPEQAVAYDAVSRAIQEDRYEGFLLHGITGSGKTEVYLQCIETVRSLGRQAILLVPEISLTPQLIRILQGRFGERVGVLHSGLSDAERSRQWLRAKKGLYEVMIGPRSALFTPFPKLGLVILDEEHEASYKSEEMPTYHARDVAEELCRRRHCPLLLGSATPSVESYYKATKGHYTLLRLTKRATGAFLPDTHIVDMRREAAEGRMGIFSETMVRAISERLQRKEQTILFLNRKGYATFVNCRSCGFVLRCPKCYLPYTYHRDKKKLICHHCGKAVELPSVCPQCGSPHVRQFGVGTQRVEAEIAALFPQAHVQRMDQNTTGRREEYDRLYQQMIGGDIDILVGTQMVAKGFDFPKVTLVGIVAADMLLFHPDYHSTERTFQLLTQAAGRAGRGTKPGEVILQTFAPEHYCIQRACEQDYEHFYHDEITARQLMNCPPFVHIFQILLSAGEEETVQKEAERLYAVLLHYGKERDFLLFQPTPASLGRINNTFRWKILIQHTDRDRLQKYGRYCIEKFLTTDPRSVISSDIDPNTIF